MRKNNKGFAQIILILVVIALAGGGMYYFGTLKNNSKVTETPTEEPIAMETQKPGTPTVKPTTDPTANWELYSNNENGYSLKFPKDLYIRLVCTGEELTSTVRVGTDKRPSPVVVGECNRGGRYELETKTYTTIQPEPETTKYYNIVKKDIKIGEISGKIYIYTFTNIEDGPYSKWYAEAKVNKNGKTYEIYFGDKDKLDLFYQILSTFKFTNTSTLKYSIDEIGKACVALRGSSKYWDAKYLECNGAGEDKTYLQDFCKKYGGNFVSNGDTCRHAQEEGVPCGPSEAFYCNFNK